MGGLATAAGAQTATTIRVSVASDGSEVARPSSQPAIPEDGQVVVFVSDAANLVDDDRNDLYDEFVHDHASGETTRVSVRSNGVEGNGESSGHEAAVRDRLRVGPRPPPHRSRPNEASEDGSPDTR